MALSYVCNLKYRTTSIGDPVTFANYQQTVAGGQGPFNDLNDALIATKANYEGFWGGTFSWTSTNNGEFTDYVITFTGLTTDPATDALNGYDLVSIAFFGNEYFSGSFISTEICQDNGLCPTCPPSVNPDDATDCPDCYSDEVPFCDTPISILGLADSTQYTFSIIDQATGRTYTYTATTDANGQADLATADFPAGLFTPYNGPFTITINDVNGDPVVLTYGYVNYSCVEVTITNSVDYTP